MIKCQAQYVLIVKGTGSKLERAKILKMTGIAINIWIKYQEKEEQFTYKVMRHKKHDFKNSINVP